jgi:hypothetical protein
MMRGPKRTYSATVISIPSVVRHGWHDERGRQSPVDHAPGVAEARAAAAGVIWVASLVLVPGRCTCCRRGSGHMAEYGVGVRSISSSCSPKILREMALNAA